MKPGHAVMSLALAVALGVFMLTTVHAQGVPPPKGLFAEVSTQVDGASVRRIRDREGGVLCYVATGHAPGPVYQGLPWPDGRNVAISCIQIVTVNP